ncbi:GLPGLI family protein [uncultured Chryseobacterium sp.]|uniref:GLPGLI family protein n=1 Tax=uncultured Chryseobacterium sp. TaxID=259322 RepID=UPI0025E72F0F|nr:GLPGLI family protein [uncultured Chryseobacterium sp.]
MKKYFSLGSLLLISIVFAQNQRFSYEYRSVPDFSKPNDTVVQTMRLETSPKGSSFYSYETAYNDSIRRIQYEKQLEFSQNLNISQADAASRKRYFKDKISKTYPKFEIFSHTSIGRDKLKVEESRPIKWQILNEKENIGLWSTQKAKTEFAGRKWTAWFTTEIPLQEGPYKFYGLPGLIVKMEDETKSHVFLLKEVKNMPENFEIKNIADNKEVKASVNQYAKLIKQHNDDPMRTLRTAEANGQIKITPENRASYEKSQKTRLENRKNENPIEIQVN